MINTSKILFSTPLFLEKPYSWVQHIPFAYYLTDIIKPQVFVELGTHSGNSYFAFCQAVNQLKLSTKCYAVDTWQGDEHASFYGKEVYDNVKKINSENFAHISNLMKMTFDDATSYFSDGSIDLLHIDGLHTYEAVKHDFENWLPKLSPKGVVIFHDTNVRERQFGVWKYWEEVRVKYPSFEFLHGHGLGLICVGNSNNEDLLKFIEYANSENYVQLLFATLGNRILALREKEDFKIENQVKIKILKNEQEERVKLNLKVDNLDLELKQSVHNTKELNEKLRKKEEELLTLTSNLNKLQKDIVKKEDDLLILSNETKGLKSSLEKKDISLQELNSKLEVISESIKEKENSLIKSEDEKRDLDRAFNKEKSKNEELSNKVIKLELLSEKQQGIIKEKESIIKEKESIIKEKEGIIKQVLNSRSWRFTKPLRDLMNRYIRINQIFGLIIRLFIYSISFKWRSVSRELNYFKWFKIINSSGLFDENWYCKINPDVKRAKINPIFHYLRRGAAEGRDPSPVFNTKKYLQSNSDVAVAGINPLIHFILYGKSENRRTFESNYKTLIQKEIINTPILLSNDFKNEKKESPSNYKVKRKYDKPDTSTEKVFLNQIKSIKKSYPNDFENVKASIVMPTFNRSYCIEKAINSVVNQTHKNFELLITDDGSTDNTSEIIKKYIDDPRIIYERINKSGVSAARNNSLNKATGDIVFYLDSDNTWESDLLENMIVFISHGRIDAAFCGSKVYDSTNKLSYYRGDRFIWTACYEQNYVDMNSFCHRRDLLGLPNFDTSIKRLVDWDFILKVTATNKTSYAPFYGVNYYDGDQGNRITHTEYKGAELSRIESIIRNKHDISTFENINSEILRPIWTDVLKNKDLNKSFLKRESIDYFEGNVNKYIDGSEGWFEKEIFNGSLVGPNLTFKQYALSSSLLKAIGDKPLQVNDQEFKSIVLLAEEVLGKIEKRSETLSVIFTTNNCNASNVIESLSSVINQSLKPSEVIIAIPKGEEKLIEIVKEHYGKNFSGDIIKFIKVNERQKPNQINNVLPHIKNSLIAYLEEGCGWHFDYLKLMTSLFVESDEITTAYTSTANADLKFHKENWNTLHGYKREHILNENFIDLNSFVNRRYVQEQIGGFDTELKDQSSWDFIIRCTKVYEPAYINIFGLVTKKDDYENIDLNIIQNTETFKIIQSKHISERIRYGLVPQKLAYVLWDWPALSQTFVLNEIRWLVNNNIDVKVYYKVSPDRSATLDFEVDSFCVNDSDELADLLVLHKRSICHGYFAYPATTLLLYPACIKTSTPFTFIAHAVDIFHESNRKRNNIKSIVEDPLCLKVFVPGDYHRLFLEGEGVSSEKIAYNIQAVDLNPFEAIKEKTRSESEKPLRGLFIGRFVEKKGLDVLVDAAYLLKDEQVEFDIYGYGPLEDSIRKKINKYGIKNVALKGPLDNIHELKSAIETSDFLVVSSLTAKNGDREGFPTIIFEAMAASRPVVTTAVSAVPSYLSDMVEAIIAEPNNPQSLSNAVKRLLIMSPDRLSSLLDAAKSFLERNIGTAITMQNYFDVWKQNVVDIFMVTHNSVKYENKVDTFEILNRILKHTSTPFVLTIIDNNSEQDFQNELIKFSKDKPNIRLVLKNKNIFCGPASNVALNLSESKYAIYLCSKEAFVGKHGWERKLINHIRTNPNNVIAGYKTHLPNYTLGKDLQRHPDFNKFRNQDFALSNSQKPFTHIQGGIYILNREIFQKHGGFSPSFPQGNMDVEYSYYLESLGYELGKVEGVVSLTTKTLPRIESVVDNKTVVAHPLTKDTAISILDNRVNSTKAFCNICGEPLNNLMNCLDPSDSSAKSCRSCGSTAFGRLIFRRLTHDYRTFRNKKILLFTRDMALASVLGNRMFKVEFAGENIRKGIKLLESKRSEIDIIVLDSDVFEDADISNDEILNAWGTIFIALNAKSTLLYTLSKNPRLNEIKNIAFLKFKESNPKDFKTKISKNLNSSTFHLDWRRLIELDIHF